jgi:hypothetical protein
MPSVTTCPPKNIRYCQHARFRVFERHVQTDKTAAFRWIESLAPLAEAPAPSAENLM